MSMPALVGVALVRLPDVDIYVWITGGSMTGTWRSLLGCLSLYVGVVYCWWNFIYDSVISVVFTLTVVLSSEVLCSPSLLSSSLSMSVDMYLILRSM